MDFSVSPEQRQLRETIINFARAELNEGIEQRDLEQEFPRDLWLKCGRERLQGLPVPESYGGRGLDPLSCAMALEALGYGCVDSGLVFSVCAHLVASVVPIWKFGSDVQRARYLPSMCRGATIGCNAITEPDTGSDAFAMASRAVPDGDGFRITGKKRFISNAPVADVALIYALTDPEKRFHGGVTAFLIDCESPGFRVTRKLSKMGLRTVLMGEMELEGVYAAPEAVLGGIGGGPRIFTHSMDWERVILFASHVGTMERLLEASAKHAATRKQFGQAIAKFQAVSHSLADVKVRLEAARLLVYRAAWNLERSRNVSLDAAIAKLFVSESLVDAAQVALQIHAGYGYLTESGIERAVRDALGSTIYSGTSEMQRNIIARWMGL
jgi:alkylation response protein AidB-like acyl-CoA dehydrogenase